MVNGKAKGSQYERDICKLLSLWVSAGEKTDLYWRSAMSGGRATVAASKGVLVRQAGDITAVSPEGHSLTDRCYLELKHYKSLDLEGFFLRGKGTLAGFWRETVKQAKRYERQPLLIARQNRTADLILGRPGALIPLVTPRLLGMVIRVNLPGMPPCEVRLFNDLLRCAYKGA